MFRLFESIVKTGVWSKGLERIHHTRDSIRGCTRVHLTFIRTVAKSDALHQCISGGL